MAEQMGNPICYKGTIADFNNGVSSGYYDVRGTVQNGPVPSFYGILLIIQGGSEIVQITSTNSNNLYLRTSTNGGTSWASWSALN